MREAEDSRAQTHLRTYKNSMHGMGGSRMRIKLTGSFDSVHLATKATQ